MGQLKSTIKNVLPEPMLDGIRQLRSLARRCRNSIRNSSFKPYVKAKTVEGISFDLLIGDRDAQIWYDLKASEPDWPEMRFYKQNMVAPGDVIFECGAHHGCTTVMLSRMTGPVGHVHAFEALPANFAIVRKNIDLNGLTNVTAYNLAVGEGRGTVQMDGLSNSSIMSGGRGVAVEMVPLDAYAHLSPDLVKIDVEGYEVQVLEGAREILARRPKLAIEIHANTIGSFGHRIEDIFAHVDREAYDFHVQWDDASAPCPYCFECAITSRVHLFARPKA